MKKQRQARLSQKMDHQFQPPAPETPETKMQQWEERPPAKPQAMQYIELQPPRTLMKCTLTRFLCSTIPGTALIGRWQATNQITPSNETDAPSSGEPPSSRKSAHAKRYGKTDTEDVYDHADKHHLKGKRTFGCGRER